MEKRGFCVPCLLRGAASSGSRSTKLSSSSLSDMLGEAGPVTFGDYELIEKVGEGGMGLVYRARKLSLKKEVAVKFIKAGRDASERQVAFFLREAELASQLDHPHIAPVYEVGEKDGARYLVMRYIPGVPLSRWMTDVAFDRSARARVGLMLKIARAVHHAHQRGIIHRDLKPGNILIDKDGTPFVTDFGLARWVEEDSTITIGDHMIGTPAYMPPEQITGQRDGITVASDVWSLGVMLWQLIMGRLPFEGSPIGVLIHAIVHHEPSGRLEEPPTLAGPHDQGPVRFGFEAATLEGCSESERRDLRSICLRCLEKDPARRYASAGELSLDLERWLEGRSVVARQAGKIEQAWRWCRRRPAIAGLIGGLIAASIVAAIASSQMLYQSRIASANAELRRQFNHVADMNLAQLALSKTNLAMFDNVMNASSPSPGSEDLRGIEWGLLKSIGASMSTTTNFFSSSEPILGFAVAPDGQQLAFLTDPKLRLKDFRGATLGEWPSPNDGKLGCVVYSKDGRRAAWACSSGVRVLDIPGGTPSLLTDEPQHVLDFSPDGRWLAATVLQPSADEPMGKVTVFDVEKGISRYSITLDGPSIRWTVDSGRLLVAGRRGSLHAWKPGDTAASEVMRDVEVSPTAVFSADGTMMARASSSGTLFCLDVARQSSIGSQGGFPARDVRMTFSAQGGLLAAVRSGEIVEIFRATPTGLIQDGRKWVTGHTKPITAMAFFNNDRALLTSSLDGSLRVQVLSAVQPKPYIEIPHRLLSGAGVSPVFSPGGGMVALLEENHYYTNNVKDSTILWDLEKNQIAGRIPSQVIAWAEESLLLSWDHNGDLRMWEVKEPQKPVNKAAFRLNPNHTWSIDSKLADHGRWIVSLDSGMYPQAFEVATGLIRRPPTEVECELIFASPSTPFVALSHGKSGRNGAALWNLRENRVTELVTPQTADALFSDDGRLLAISDWGRHLELFDGTTGSSLETLGGHGGAVATMAFDREGQRLLTGGDDHSLMIWNLPTRRMVFRERVEAPISWIRASPDGRWLATGHLKLKATAVEGHFRLWPLAGVPARPIQQKAPPSDSVWARYLDLAARWPAGAH